MEFYNNLRLALNAISRKEPTDDIDNVDGNKFFVRIDDNGNLPSELERPINEAMLIKVKTANKKENDTNIEPFYVNFSLKFINVEIQNADENFAIKGTDFTGMAVGRLINMLILQTNAIPNKYNAFIVNDDKESKSLNDISIDDLITLKKSVSATVDDSEAFVMSPTVADKLTEKGIIEDGKIDGTTVVSTKKVKYYIGYGVFSNYTVSRIGEPIVTVTNIDNRNLTEIRYNDNLVFDNSNSKAFSSIKINE